MTVLTYFELVFLLNDSLFSDREFKLRKIHINFCLTVKNVFATDLKVGQNELPVFIWELPLQTSKVAVFLFCIICQLKHVYIFILVRH